MEEQIWLFQQCIHTSPLVLIPKAHTATGTVPITATSDKVIISRKEILKKVDIALKT